MPTTIIIYKHAYPIIFDLDCEVKKRVAAWGERHVAGLQYRRYP